MCCGFFLQCVNMNQARGIFGFTGESSIGQIGFPAVQVCCSFEAFFWSCAPCASDW